MNDAFLDRRILITGASRNTGLAIARRFLQAGATVILNATTPEGVARAIDALGAGKIIPAPADVSDPAQVEAMFALARRECDGLDALVNNAAFQAIGHPFVQTPLETLERALRVNLMGVFHCSQLAARWMIERGRKGAIVNLGSNVSERAIRDRSAYVASKGGIDALTRAMAIELGPHGIRVNTVAPGYINTERWETLDPAIAERRRENVPLGQEASGEEIADAVLFLASDAARRITGARLVIDGGCSAQLVPLAAEG